MIRLYPLFQNLKNLIKGSLKQIIKKEKKEKRRRGKKKGKEKGEGEREKKGKEEKGKRRRGRWTLFETPSKEVTWGKDEVVLLDSIEEKLSSVLKDKDKNKYKKLYTDLKSLKNFNYLD